MQAPFRLESSIAVYTGRAGATLTIGRQFQAGTDRVIRSLDVYNNRLQRRQRAPVLTSLRRSAHARARACSASGSTMINEA